MAASTSINFSLQARDWEALVGIISNSADTAILDVVFKLQTWYNNLVTKPPLTTPISIATTEEVVVKLSTFLFGNTVFNIASDLGANTFTRCMTAIRAANNSADNYISTQLATNDAKYGAAQLAIRKNGRGTIMMLTYDGQ